MLNNGAINMGALPPRQDLPVSRAVLVALGIEIVLLIAGSIAIASAKSTPVTAAEQTLELSFEEPQPKKIEKIEPKPQPKQVIQPVVKHHVATPVKVAVTPPAPAPVQHTPVTNTPVAEPVVAPPPPPPPPPTVNNEAAEKEASFAAQLKAAIITARVYPPAARMMGTHGKTKLGFTFQDGVSSQIHIIKSSGSPMFDQAAIQAVTAAPVPPIPESLKGKKVNYEVEVVF
jgi:TonB family protein